MLAAFTIKIILSYSQRLESLETTSKIKAETEALAVQIPDRELVKKQHRALTENMKVITESSSLLLERFVDHTNAKYQITPKNDTFSVLERPEFKENGGEFLKTYLLHSPDSQELAIQVEFKPSSYARNATMDFESTDDIRISIPHGGSRLVVAFTEIQQETPDQEWYLKVFLDDAEVVSREFVGVSPRMGLQQSTNILLDPQRDFTSKDKLPLIAQFQPMFSKSEVQVSVVRVESGE